MTYDPFMASLPYVNPFSGLIPDDAGFMDTETGKIDYTGKDTAIDMIFSGDDQTWTRRVDALREELTSLGFSGNLEDVARTIALYHAASDYCDRFGRTKSGYPQWTVAGLFPAIQRDFDGLLLDIEQYEATHGAFQESKFEDHLLMPAPAEKSKNLNDLFDELLHDYEEFREI